MLDTLFRLALSPVLIAQALRVRRTAQLLPEADGPREGQLGTGPELRLAIIGDSSAAGVGVAHQSEALSGQLAHSLAENFNLHWQLDALTGATTASTLQRLQSSAPLELDVVLVVLGVNDVTRLIPQKLWLRQQDELLARIDQLYQPRHIYLSAIPPMEHFPLLPNPLRWTLGRHAQKLRNAMTQKVTQTAKCSYLHVAFDPKPEFAASDGFHPSAELYALWGKELASRILSDWPKISTKS